MESVGDVSADFQKSMVNMMLDTDASAVPSIEQLTAGNYTMGLPNISELGAEETADVKASP